MKKEYYHDHAVKKEQQEYLQKINNNTDYMLKNKYKNGHIL